MRSMPYATPASTVSAEAWTLNGAPVTTTLPGWDYESVLEFERVVRVDVLGTLTGAGLAPGVPLALHVRYRAGGSLLRRSSVLARLVPDDTSGWAEVHLVAPVHGEELAAALVLETTLVRLDDGEGTSFTPRRCGSILWRDSVELALEGSGGLLPVAPVRFSEHGLPANAAWYVTLDGSDWSAPAMGNLLVLLNMDNPAIAEALVPAANASTTIWNALMVDLVCDLVGRALGDEEYSPTESKSDEISTGDLVTNLVRSFLARPGEHTSDAVTRLRDEWRRDPSLIRACAQSSLRFPSAAS